MKVRKAHRYTKGRFELNRRFDVCRLVGMFIAITILISASLTAQTRTELLQRLSEQEQQIENLRTAIRTQGTTIQYMTQNDSAGLSANPFVQQQIQAQVDEANDIFVQRTMLWIVLLIAIGMGLIVLLFITRYSMKKRLNDLEQKLTMMKGALGEEAVSRENRVVEQQANRLLNAESTISDDPFSPFADHSLPLRVADEIHRMRKRLSYMDDDTKGLNALKHSLKRLEEQLNDGGYELVDLAGKKYVDGLNVEARFVPAEDGAPPEETITDTIRPQVNYMGVIIQQAKVEVSKSYS